MIAVATMTVVSRFMVLLNAHVCTFFMSLWRGSLMLRADMTRAIMFDKTVSVVVLAAFA